ncbi:Uncharacterised protein [Mycobacteroides abscessus]|nr:Uncharacterised protein [Mycobacteroides abscessus]
MTRSRPAAMMLPHEGSGSGTPAWMKDSDASKTIASATSTVVNTSTGAAQLRATCLARIQAVRAPMTRVAAT